VLKVVVRRIAVVKLFNHLKTVFFPGKIIPQAVGDFHIIIDDNQFIHTTPYENALKRRLHAAVSIRQISALFNKIMKDPLRPLSFFLHYCIIMKDCMMMKGYI
jgi:hypothetical protein